MANHVTRENLDGVDLATVSWTTDNALTPNGGTSYLYIACYSWTFKFTGNYALFGSPTHTVRLQHWDGSKWVSDGSFSNKNQGDMWINVNNRSGTGKVNSSIRTWVWRISFSNSSGYYKGAGKGYLYLCGMGHCPDTSYPKGCKIAGTKGGAVYKVLKRSGSNTDTSQDAGFNVVPSDAKLGGLFETSALRGNPITLWKNGQCRFVPKLDGNYVPQGITL